ncbi:hypothetical protein DEO72_LG2g3163 [Vigna unguiculata]|uniref:Uncharacterized protein n=1 Tax=Vigna unguiculata TaxID=3917 RepID=A0A4D6L2T2_VIGUN|nr:hypothetical protein DEO72_LG2g3163 [Vigna unguiculata]
MEKNHFRSILERSVWGAHEDDFSISYETIGRGEDVVDDVGARPWRFVDGEENFGGGVGEVGTWHET